MSFDEKQYLDNDEINLADLFKHVWFYKFSLLILIVLSVPISVMISTTLEPTFKAETVFEKLSDNDSSDDDLSDSLVVIAASSPAIKRANTEP